MKCLIIFPPQWIPFNPHLAPAAIQSILSNSGHEVKTRDLNIEFYNTVLSPQFFLASVERAFRAYNEKAAGIFAERQKKKDLKAFPAAFQNAYLRMKETEKIAKANEYPVIAKYLADAAAVLRDRERYYDHQLLDKALSVIKKATDILSAVYHPSRVNFLNITAITPYSFDDLKSGCKDKDGNIFHHFFETVLPSILEDNPNYIGISLGDYTQIIPALTLAMLLKSRSSAHINIGGNLLGRHTDIFTGNQEFFSLFADSIIYNEGERPVLELMRHLEGRAAIEDVPNLIYSRQGSAITNDEAELIRINDLFTADYKTFPLASYYTPEVILNIQTSRNCYWRKCSFCTHHFGSKYNVKPAYQIVDEIRQLKERHGTRYFHFVDEAISRLSEATV